MVKKKRGTGKRNPARNITIHNREDLLKRAIAERGGSEEKSRSSRSNKSRSSSIRERVYSDERTSSVKRKKDRTQKPSTVSREIKNESLRPKRSSSVPSLKDAFLYFTKREKSDIISKGVRDERYNSNIIAAIIGLVVFGIIFAYSLSFAVKLMQKKEVVANDTVTYGSIESAQPCNGVVVRDEIVYNSPAAGEVVFNVSDTDKVKANTEICSVQDTAAVESLQEDLDKINEEMLEMQKTRESISAVSDEVKQYNTQIKSSSDNYAFRLVSGDISVLYSMKSDVQKLIDTRNQRLLSENSGSMSDLASQRAAQVEKINNSKNAVVVQDGGVVSCYSDGLEAEYTFDRMGDLTEKDVGVKTTGQALNKEVEEGDPLFKIVRSNDWYIVSYIPNSQIEDWSVGDIRNIYMHTENEGTKPLEIQVASLNTGDKTSLAVLKSTKYLTDYINVRSIEFETSKASSGYKIPNSAIVEQTMLKVSRDFVVDNKVYKQTADGTLVELSVVPAGEDTEEGIIYIPFDIDRLNVGDTLSLPSDKPRTFTISDVVTVKGVFVMNTGIADFCKINLDNSSSNADYTVLDPSVNANIKLYDRIVTDTLNIEKQQKLIS